MPKQQLLPLPEPLRHLQPFVRALARLPAEQLNEDVDASQLDTAIRTRLRGLDEVAAVAVLAEDLALLETWLKTRVPSDHAAHWVLGYLSAPGVAQQLARPPEPLVVPAIEFVPPRGWKVNVVPFQLHLKKGKLIGDITATDEQTLDRLQRQRERLVVWPGLEKIKASLEITDVRFGDVFGKKHLSLATAPVTWKHVDYYLAVPGGFVTVFLDALGTDFDELPFEAQAHTLRVAAPATAVAASPSK